MDVTPYLAPWRNMSGIPGAFEPIPTTALDQGMKVEGGKPLPCMVGALPHDADWDALATEPHDDQGALDEVWVLWERDGTIGTRRVGRGTVHVRREQVEGVECVRPVLQWQGRTWPVCCVLGCCASQDTRWSLTHMVWDGGWEGLTQAIRGQIEPDQYATVCDTLRRDVLNYWRDGVNLTAARDDARSGVVRSTALTVPSVAGQLLPYAVPGRHIPGVRRHLGKVARISGGGDTGTVMRAGRRVTTHADVQVRITLEGRQSTGQTARIVLPSDWVEPRLPFMHGAAEELPSMVVAELAAVLGARNLMPALATFGVIAARGGVELDDSGSIPDDVRCEVMRLTGCPPRRANTRQKRDYQKLMEFLRWAQLEVNTKARTRRSKLTYRPLLIASQFEDPNRVKGVRLVVNPDVMSDSVRLPLALLGITDAEDPQGLIRALGAAIVWRVAMSSAKPERLGKPESLRKFLERAGQLGQVNSELAKEGAPAVMAQLDRALTALRSMSWTHDGHHEVVDLIGGTRVEWGRMGSRALDQARVRLAVPGWMGSNNTPTLPMLPPAKVG